MKGGGNIGSAIFLLFFWMWWFFGGSEQGVNEITIVDAFFIVCAVLGFINGIISEHKKKK